jgi:TPP-dependent pyruvate/acetoin dehydrogenase alpha subunit
MRKDLKLSLFKSMLRIRMVEERLASLYSEQEMRCPMHLCIGQEAIAVGVSHALIKDDKVFSNHRAHGHYLAKGGDLLAMIAELYGRDIGCCGGRGGSMHMIDLSVGFMGATPIVGGTVPLAVGSAWASKLMNDRLVTTVYFGDGCFEEGVLHESMNFAALHQLPVLFVCENNDFSVYTKLELRQPKRPIFKVAEAHSIKSQKADGNDIELVHKISSDAVAEIRNGSGPQFLEFSAYRWREHCGPDFDDHLNYRTHEEVEVGKKACPVARYQEQLLKNGDLTDQMIGEVSEKIEIEISQVFQKAKAARFPDFIDAMKHQYA